MPLRPETSTWLKNRLLPALFIAAVAVVPYLGVLDTPAVFDDVKLVQDNKRLHSPLPDWRQVAATFDITSRQWDAEELRPNYRPLRFLSYWVDAKLTELWFGPIPATGPPVFFFHATNILLHACNALLVFALATSLARTCLGDRPGAESRRAFFGLASGLIFAAHPLATEAVTYISGRRDVLSAFFFLAASALHLRAPPASSPRWGSSLLALAALALGLLTKETLVTLPPALLLLDWARRARFGPGRVSFHVAAIALAAGFSWITLANERLIAAGVAAAEGPVLATACRYLARYCGLFLAPLSQSVDYSYSAILPSTGWLAPWTTLPAVVTVLAVIFGAGVLLVRPLPGRRETLLVPLGVFWFVGNLVPVLQFVPIAEQFAERFAYVSAVGGILLVAWGLVNLRDRDRLLGWAGLGLLSVACIALTVRRNGDWETPLRLWEAAVKAQPAAGRARLGLANELKQTGRFPEAIAEYSQAIAILETRPEVPLHQGFLLQALWFRGSCLGILGERDPESVRRGIADYRRVLGMRDADQVAIESSPRHVVLHSQLAMLLLQQGENDAAEAEYRRVVEIAPDLPIAGGAHYYLARIAQKKGRGDLAIEAYRRAQRVIPPLESAWLTVTVELVDLFLERKEVDAALREVTTALGQAATPVAKHVLLLRQAKGLDRKGDIAGAIAALEEILAEDPRFGAALLSLAHIERAQSKFDSAEKRYQAVLALDPANAEAIEGLQNVALLRRVAEGKTGEGSQGDPTALLEAMEKKGLEAINRGELLAARDIFSRLLLRATDARRLEFQLLSLRALARVEESLGRYKQAEASLKKALELDGGDARAMRQLADLYLQRFEDRATARTFYERALAAEPKNAPADPLVHFNLAELIGSGDALTALAHLEKARQAGYVEPAMDRALGYRLAELSRYQDALDAFNRYFERTPVLDASGDEDPVRRAAKDFVKKHVLPHVQE